MEADWPEHEIVLVIEGLDPHDEDFETNLFRAGCDDATPSLRNGVLRLDFTRVAPTRDAAVESVIASARKAGARVLDVEAMPEPTVP